MWPHVADITETTVMEATFRPLKDGGATGAIAPYTTTYTSRTVYFNKHSAMPVVTRTMRRSFEGQPPDFVSLKTAPLVSETKATVLKQRLAAIDTNIPISTTSQRLLAKANADIGKPLSSPTKSSRLPVPVLRERSSGQPCTPVKSGVGKSRRGLRGPIRKLPDTLLARIIDCLHADPDTLAACTLVHPSWTDRARHHLFASLTFGVFPQYDTPDVALGPLHTFSATATHNIRQLVLNFVEATHVPRLNISGLGRALAKLPNLDDLVLAGLTLWAGPVHEARAGPPQRVEELALDDMTLDPRELLQLLAVVAPRHKLSLGRDIKVRSKFWVDDVSPPALRVLEKVSWKELAMGFHEGRKYGVIMGALRKTRMPRRLETLAIDQLWAPDVPAIQEIFADVSATLRRLTLNLTECASTPGESFSAHYMRPVLTR